jgi:hypothetical protein
VNPRSANTLPLLSVTFIRDGLRVLVVAIDSIFHLGVETQLSRCCILLGFFGEWWGIGAAKPGTAPIISRFGRVGYVESSARNIGSSPGFLSGGWGEIGSVIFARLLTHRARRV